MFSLNKKNRRFTEIFNDYYTLIFSTINLKVNDLDAAEDITQNVFIILYEKLDQVENPRKWLYGVMKFEVLKYLEKKRPGEDIDDVFQDVSLMYVNGFRDTRIILDEAMNSVAGEHDHLLLDLVAIQRFTYEEAGRELGMTTRQVRYRYGLAVRQVLDCLNKKGIKTIEELL